MLAFYRFFQFFSALFRCRRFPHKEQTSLCYWTINSTILLFCCVLAKQQHKTEWRKVIALLPAEQSTLEYAGFYAFELCITSNTKNALMMMKKAKEEAEKKKKKKRKIIYFNCLSSRFFCTLSSVFASLCSLFASECSRFFSFAFFSLISGSTVSMGIIFTAAWKLNDGSGSKWAEQIDRASEFSPMLKCFWLL